MGCLCSHPPRIADLDAAADQTEVELILDRLKEPVVGDAKQRDEFLAWLGRSLTQLPAHSTNSRLKIAYLIQTIIEQKPNTDFGSVFIDFHYQTPEQFELLALLISAPKFRSRFLSQPKRLIHHLDAITQTTQILVAISSVDLLRTIFRSGAVEIGAWESPVDFYDALDRFFSRANPVIIREVYHSFIDMVYQKTNYRLMISYVSRIDSFRIHLARFYTAKKQLKLTIFKLLKLFLVNPEPPAEILAEIVTDRDRLFDHFIQLEKSDPSKEQLSDLTLVRQSVLKS